MDQYYILFGGHGRHGLLNDLHILNTFTMTWVDTGNMPHRMIGEKCSEELGILLRVSKVAP